MIQTINQIINSSSAQFVLKLSINFTKHKPSKEKKGKLNRSELRLYSCWLCSCQVSVSTYKKKGGSVIPVRLSCICCECKTKKKTNMFIQREEEKAVYLNAGSGGEDGNLTSNTIFIEKRTISRHQLPRGLSQ